MSNSSLSTLARVAVIGSGGRGASVLKRLIETGNTIEPAGLHDPDGLALKRAVEWVGLDDSIICTEDAIFSDSSIEWVIIASPNALHADHVCRAFAAGKNVFCEKPLATQCADIPRMVEAWRDSSKVFAFGLVLRHSPFYRKVKELLDAGSVGTILSLEFNDTLTPGHGGYIHGNWRRKQEMAGTHLLEKCCHDIDLCCWFAQSRPMLAASFGGLDFFTPNNRSKSRSWIEPDSGKNIYRAWSDLHGIDPFNDDKDIIDNQVAIFQFESGCRATFHTNCNAAINERRFYILGTEGAIRADAISGMIEVKSTNPAVAPQVFDSGVRGGHAGGDQFLAESFSRTILQGEAPPAGMEDGARSLISARGVDHALESGSVYHLADDWQRFYDPFFPSPKQ